VNEQSLGVLLASGNVTRCHTIPTIKPQTVGAHTWRAVVILHWLYAPAYPPAPLTYALTVHDIPELKTGDMPGDTKYANPALAAALERSETEFLLTHGIADDTSLTHTERCVLGLCDRADLVMYALDEVEMGNLNMLHVAEKAYSMAQEQRILGLMASCGHALYDRSQVLMQGMYDRLQNNIRRVAAWQN